MDTKMKEMGNDPYPTTSPPPYSASAPGPSQPAYGMPAQPRATVFQPGQATVIQPGQATVIQPGQATVISSGRMVPAVVLTNSMGPNPTTYTCHSCNYQIITRIERNPAMRTHLFAILLCVIGCWPCVCLPYCMESCNNTDHYCPNCNAYIGSYMS